MSPAGRRGKQLIRTLHLLRALGHTWYSLQDLATMTDVTVRTIRRDVWFLRAHGFVILQRGKSHYGRRLRGDLELTVTAWPENFDLTGERKEELRKRA